VLLWAGADRGVAAAFSHETALQRYELSDSFPEKLHLTVPHVFSRRAPVDVVLRRAALGTDDVRRENLLAYTTPARTFLDLLVGGFPLEPLRGAYREALDRGLVRRGALQSEGTAVRAYLESVAPARTEDLRERLALLLEGF